MCTEDLAVLEDIVAYVVIGRQNEEIIKLAH